jgi:hypothetical protein
MMVFCDSALLSHHTTFEFHGGAPGHAHHSVRYQILRTAYEDAAVSLSELFVAISESLNFSQFVEGRR